MNKRKDTDTPATASKKSKKSKQWKHPDSIVVKSETCVVIKDKHPKAKVHYLVLPHDHITSIYKLNSSHLKLLDDFGDLFKEIQDKMNIHLKAGFLAVPAMQKLHMHIISEDMVAPCLQTKVHWNSFTTSFFKSLQGKESILIATQFHSICENMCIRTVMSGEEPKDVQEELKEKGCIKKILPELHKQLMATELLCNQCSYKPEDMSQLKEHLLTHIK